MGLPQVIVTALLVASVIREIWQSAEAEGGTTEILARVISAAIWAALLKWGGFYG